MHNRLLRILAPLQAISMALELHRHVGHAEAMRSLLPRQPRGYRRPWSETTGRAYATNGKRECARRRAQIAAGRLTAANGLAV